MASFPLPQTFFRCPPLSEKDEITLREFAEQASVDLVQYSQLENGPIKWTLLEDDHDVQVFVGHDPTAPPRVISYISSTEVHATIDEVSALFQAETPEDYATYRRNFAKDIIDGALLYTIAKPTETNPRHFVGVRWMVVGSPVPAVINHRDFCSMEGRYDFDVNGRRGWMRSFKSIKLGACPDFGPTLGLVRGSHHRVGYVFLESDRPGFLKVTQLMQLDTGGNVPTWLNRFSAKRRARSIGQIETHVREKRLASTAFVSEAFLVDKTHRSRCFLCQRKFGAFGVKYSCQKCGEVVCKSCCKVWKVHMGTATGTRVEPTRVCTTCSLGSSQYGGSGSCLAMSSSTTPKLVGSWTGSYNASPCVTSLPRGGFAPPGMYDSSNHVPLQPHRNNLAIPPQRDLTQPPYYHDASYDEYNHAPFRDDRFDSPHRYGFPPAVPPHDDGYGPYYYDGGLQYQGQPKSSPQPGAWWPPPRPDLYDQRYSPAYYPQHHRPPPDLAQDDSRLYYPTELSPYRTLPPLPPGPLRQLPQRGHSPRAEPLVHPAPATASLTCTPKGSSVGDERNDLIRLEVVNVPHDAVRNKPEYADLTKAFTGAPATSSTSSDGSSLLVRSTASQQRM
ncbi:hypothetical protein H310_14436 [Aphanomyces invadans]|uniref:FYVE-type domain-containing protein n=1 Tax=Aphanomyces invadans TaxID=157072 RepID=A0A024TB64_9STRA|nr:hypothetical protein H310_14436 [Aphanomyces invadans]ETV90841.1 hypothetical protein H310_14436 [Aphanomyces invadans]|eukprot:XP_008880519.1 hypothetical protein H310_14436 [Aphanomyces invadans]